ncbi:HCP-like protein [Dioscorea alata]|uniref:HCP-like protein n=3 Tax=Dioscorea alata TaxID=55571 RepID=A0ACB7VTP9_DIOAL|nr:HCP-like protein [Dioscorea alata]KAH7677733.1 HCP-like protein [Dioscorea alata]KAH7677734.1 HCP-like protein [Dioscorea alata]
MGRGPTTAANLQDYARLASERIRAARVSKPVLRYLDSSARVSIPSKRRGMEESQGRLPLSEVVADCVKRWFQDTLKEARNGDTSMQVLVGQMYHSGYGIPRNEQKAKAWLTKASRYRSSVWKVGDKQPGYNASDSDSDKEDAAKS